MPPLAMCLNAGAMGRCDAESETLIPVNRCGFDVAHALRGEGFDASEDGTGRGTPLVPCVVDTLTSNGDAHSGYRDEKGLIPVARGVTIHGTDGTVNVASFSDVAGALRTKPPGTVENSSSTVIMQPVAFDMRGREGGSQFEGPHETANIRAASGGSSRSYVAQSWAVRRLTPTECERLQGFPDGWTDVPYRGKPACDGPRYKALGNSMAVNVMRRIGRRIEFVEGLLS